MSNRVLYDGLTRGQMIYKIHMDTDYSSWCYKASNEELIAGYKEIFGECAWAPYNVVDLKFPNCYN